MRAFALRLNVVSSSKVTSSAALVILVDSVAHFQHRSRRLAARYCRTALQGRDLTDGIVGELACSARVCARAANGHDTTTTKKCKKLGRHRSGSNVVMEDRRGERFKPPATKSLLTR